jgi:hypothetical protein
MGGIEEDEMMYLGVQSRLYLSRIMQATVELRAQGQGE